jgi:DNA repair exonuclease SbcCD ATPase subunit
VKITYINLKNFAAIYSGMGKSNIKITFKNTERVILLVGPNGSGKTAILMNLHPFAYPGNLDVRNNDSLIRSELDGYKEIHIKKGKDKYIIKHHYKWNKDAYNVKSFFIKNDIELNPNGNVTSFKELVYLELGLTQDYIKLIRLGSNVTNFIDMKSTDRKTFTAEFLQDIDIYSKFYKKVNDDFRVLKSLLRTTVDKIDRLRVIDKREIEDDIKKLENHLGGFNDAKLEVESKYWQIVGKALAINPEGFDILMGNSMIVNRKLKDTLSDIEKIENKLKPYYPYDNWTDERRDKVIKDIQALESAISTNMAVKEVNLLNLNSYHDRKIAKENNLKSLVSFGEYSKMHDLYKSFVKKEAEYDKKFKDFKTVCTKDDMLTALSLMQIISNSFQELYYYESGIINKALDFYPSNKHKINKFVEGEINKCDSIIISRKMENGNCDLITEGAVLYIPDKCNDITCPLRNKLRTKMKKFNQKTPSVETSQYSIGDIESRKEKIYSILNIASIIDRIIGIIKANQDLISKLPENFFDINTLLSNLRRSRPAYIESDFTKYIQVLEEYEEYQTLKNKMTALKKEITFVEQNKSTLDMLQKELFDLDGEITRIEFTLQDINTKLTELSIHKESKEKRLLELDNVIYMTGILEALNKDRLECEADLKVINDKFSILEDLSKRQDLFDIEIKKYESRIKEVEKDLLDEKFKLIEFTKLEAERKMLEERFDEMEIIAESLSSRKGISLLIIKLYMEEVKMSTNELLDIIYRGDLEITDFDISDNDFNIPYVKSNMRVSDVRYASQGEKAFLSVALSFALMKQSMDKYNILLLDEIDATLDTHNRAVFIHILERQLDMIDAEQCFMITHNNMFDNYPVSVIKTSDSTDTMKKMSIIEIK